MWGIEGVVMWGCQMREEVGYRNASGSNDRTPKQGIFVILKRVVFLISEGAIRCFSKLTNV